MPQIDLVKYSMSENSWEQVNDNSVVKNLDFSSFKHKTTVIPIPFYKFFNLDPKSNEKVHFNLITKQGLNFPVYVRHVDKSRTTPAKLLCWYKEFDSYLQEKYPQWKTISSFTRTDAFKLSFYKTDSENEYLIDTNEEQYLKNIVYDSVLDKLDESLETNNKETTISLEPVEYSDQDIVVAARDATTKQRKELKLQNKYIDYLKACGYEAYPSQVDIIAKKDSETQFIEAKILTSQTKAAQALGQLLFYKHTVNEKDKPTKLLLLFDKKPDAETIKFIKDFQVEIVYESNKSFKKI